MPSLRLVQSAVIAAGIGCCVYGIAQGEAAAVLQKAVLVCLECVGLG